MPSFGWVFFLSKIQLPLLRTFKKVIQSRQGPPGNRPLPQRMLTIGWRYQQAIGPDYQAYRRENQVFPTTE
jgi:hypothetical protein